MSYPYAAPNNGQSGQSYYGDLPPYGSDPMNSNAAPSNIKGHYPGQPFSFNYNSLLDPNIPTFSGYPVPLPPPDYPYGHGSPPPFELPRPDTPQHLVKYAETQHRSLPPFNLPPVQRNGIETLNRLFDPATDPKCRCRPDREGIIDVEKRNKCSQAIRDRCDELQRACLGTMGLGLEVGKGYLHHLHHSTPEWSAPWKRAKKVLHTDSEAMEDERMRREAAMWASYEKCHEPEKHCGHKEHRAHENNHGHGDHHGHKKHHRVSKRRG